MKKFLALITTTVLFITSVACMTGCSANPSKKEIIAARENAITYAAKAYQTVSEQDWFDDYTFVGVHCDGYERYKEPVEEYPSTMQYVDILTGEETEIETTAVTEKSFMFEFYFIDQDNEYYRCDVVYVGASRMISVETGEVVSDTGSLAEVDEIWQLEQGYFERVLGDVFQNGYSVSSDGNVDFMITADEIESAMANGENT